MCQGDATLTFWMDSSGGVDEVHFDMSAPAAGWLGLGFAGPSGKMIDADVITGAVRGQEVGANFVTRSLMSRHSYRQPVCKHGESRLIAVQWNYPF